MRSLDGEESIRDAVVRCVNVDKAQTILIQTYTAWRDVFQDVALTPPNLCAATDRCLDKGSRIVQSSGRLRKVIS